MNEPKKSRLWVWSIFIALLLVNGFVIYSSVSLPIQQSRLFWHALDLRHWPAWYATFLWTLALSFFLSTTLQKANIQEKFRRFYRSRQWLQMKYELKTSSLNQNFVRLFVRTRFGKRLLKRWCSFWKPPRIENPHRVIYTVTAVVMASLVFCHVAMLDTVRYRVYLHGRRPYDLFFDSFYNPYFYGPWEDYLAMGKFSWLQIDAPLAATVLVCLLLRFASEIRKRRNAK